MTEQKSPPGGDNCTPDKKIGQVKYADGQQGVAQDDRGQDQPADGKRVRQSQEEGPAAYAPHQEDEAVSAHSGRDPAKKKTGEF